MSELQKAYIVEIDTTPQANETGSRFPVQFNPNSLRLQITNSMAAGPPSGSQVRQSTGSSNTTLSLELVFDTADEGSTDAPRSVREKTSQVERFVFPKAQSEDSEKPPRIRFQWGSFVIDGVVDNVNVDLDLFASNGTPLRAKVTLSIKEQNSKLIFLQAGPGSNQKGGSSGPLGLSAGLGISASVGISAGIGFSAGIGVSAGINAQFGVALGGESLPEFSARVGVDPAAWRGLSVGGSVGLSGDLSLQAGAEVGFSAGLNASAGIGVTLGVEAGVSASLEASFGLEAGAGIGAVPGVGASAGLAQGFSLSAAGGLGSAIASVQNTKSQAAESQARQAFAAPGAATPVTPAKPALPAQPRAPLALSGLPSPAQQQAAPSAPAPPRVDPRSASFGFGVPLRATAGGAARDRSQSLSGVAPLKSRTGDGLPPHSEDPTTAPWIALPVRGTPSAPAGARRSLHSGRSCGCGCGH